MMRRGDRYRPRCRDINDRNRQRDRQRFSNTHIERDRDRQISKRQSQKKTQGETKFLDHKEIWTHRKTKKQKR